MGVAELAREIFKVPTRRAIIRAFKRAGDERELAWAGVYGTAIHALEQYRNNSRGSINLIIRRCWNHLKHYWA